MPRLTDFVFRYLTAELQLAPELVDEVMAREAGASLVMQLGAQAVFVGSGIFKSSDPASRAKAIVEATTHFRDADIIARVSRDLGEAMVGINISDIPDSERMQERGW